MFRNVKPGYVLEFGTDPSSIPSPLAVPAEHNDNTLETLWPVHSNTVGVVTCHSHPSGPIGVIASEVSVALRGAARSSRNVSYSALGRALTQSDRTIGAIHMAFVGYVDGQSNYTQSGGHVISKDFSGCLMVSYRAGGVRRVAHAAASRVPMMDCKQPFLTTLQEAGYVLDGWFQPYVAARDDAEKIRAYNLINAYVGGNINNLVTFGVILADGSCFSVEAFKPQTIVGNTRYVVTKVEERVLRNSFVFA